MQVHIAYMQQMDIGPTGRVIDRASRSTTYKDVLSSTTDWRVVYDSDNPSTGDPNANPPTINPTLADYLRAEAAAGFKLQTLNQTMIITYDA